MNTFEAEDDSTSLESRFILFVYLVTLDRPEEMTIEPRSAIEGDDITLTCRAARYLYTDLQWLDSFNQTITSNMSSLQLSNYSISLSIRLHNVSQNSTTGYKCQAYKLHKRVELKTAALMVEGKLEEDMTVIPVIIATDCNTLSTNYMLLSSQLMYWVKISLSVEV